MKLLYLALGANVGQREATIRQAIDMIEQKVGHVEKQSALYETTPQGFDSTHLFLNAVVACRTTLSPHEALCVTQDIERQLGRTQKSVNGQYADRTIDIDLLVMQNEVVSDPQLTLPHPHIATREFVLRPLCDIAPDLVIPPHTLCVKQLLEALQA